MTELSASEAMRTAWDAGLSVFPLRADKRPGVTTWAPYIDQRPDEAEMISWSASDPSGYAVVMGGPERLLAIDLEAGFVERLGEFSRRLADEELLGEFTLWINGLAVRTPSNGMHVVIHLMGDEPMPGNEKLAMAGGKVLAETRAQGGYIVGYGSNGDTHPTGGSWDLLAGDYDKIAWVEPETWQAVRAVLLSFDETPTPVRPVQPSKPGSVSLARLEHTSSWIEALELPEMEPTLLHYGYIPDRNHENWTRPGKDPREGHSCTINAAGRLIMWSSNDRIPMSGNPPRTYDVVDVIAFNEGVDRMDVLRRYRPAQPASAQPSPTVDPSLALPDDFWQARPYLGQLARAAWARQTSPDLVWEAFKAMYASTIPWNFRLPDDGTLDYIAVMVGDSGSGKTLAKRAAASLLPLAIFEIEGLNPLLPPPASGEGMAEWYMDRSKNATPGALANRGGCFYLDEGQAFFDRANRQGNIVIQTMKSGWSGESIGSLAASGDRRRVIQPSAVRMSMLISIQITAAAQFLAADLSAGGLPQRISWAWAYHPGIPDDPGEWSGQLDVPVYDYHHWGGSGSSTLLHEVTVAPYVKAEVAVRRDARRRAPGSDVLDAQADYARLKTAGILALLDDRREVTSEDWMLAGLDWETSVATRGHVKLEHAQSASDAAIAAGRFQAHREIAAQGVHMEAAIASLCRKVSSSSEPLQLRQVKEHLARYRRQHGLHYREILDHAIARGKVVLHSDGTVS